MATMSTSGQFNDIVTAHAADRSYFRIGSVDEKVIDRKAVVAGSLLTYRAHAGVLELEALTYAMAHRKRSNYRH